MKVKTPVGALTRKPKTKKDTSAILSWNSQTEEKKHSTDAFDPTLVFKEITMSTSQLPKVFISRPIPDAGVERLGPHCDLSIHQVETQSTRQQFLDYIRGKDGLLIHPGVQIDEEALDVAGPQLKVISSFSVGLDHIDLDLCKKRGVKVGFTPEVLNTAVAEHAIGLTLATARRFEESLRAVRDGVWGTRWDKALWLAGKQLSGSVVGIVGLGRIGLAIAKRLAAFEVSKILYTGRKPRPESADPIGAEYVSFNDLLERSDFVIAACAINDSNKGLFNADAFRRMKQGSVFVNVSRGVLVDQDALYQALTTGQLGSAGLDVTTPEPLPASHPLLTLPNFVLTPHISSATHTARLAMCDLAVDNLLAGVRGESLKTSAY